MEKDLKLLADRYAEVCSRIAQLYEWDEPDFIRFQIDGDEVVASCPTQGECVYDDPPWIDSEEHRFARSILMMDAEQFAIFLPRWKEERQRAWEAAQAKQLENLQIFHQNLLQHLITQSSLIRKRHEISEKSE